MTYDERIRHLDDQAEANGEQFAGRAEQTAGAATGDREQQFEGLTDEAMGKLQDFKSRLQDFLDDDDADPGPIGRH